MLVVALAGKGIPVQAILLLRRLVEKEKVALQKIKLIYLSAQKDGIRTVPDDIRTVPDDIRTTPDDIRALRKIIRSPRNDIRTFRDDIRREKKEAERRWCRVQA